MLKFLQNSYFLKDTGVIMAPTRGFGFKNKNSGGFSPGQEAQKTKLDCGGQACRIIPVEKYLMLYNMMEYLEEIRARSA